MGEPKFSVRKYDRPSHPWEGARINAENELLKKYGLKNKKELWRTESMLRGFRRQSRTLQALLRTRDPQAQLEKGQLIERLIRLGLLADNSTLDDVLALNVDALLSRRLQTILYLKGMANTPHQARQFIVHGHISIEGKKVTIPGYYVRKVEEDKISYNSRSAIANDMHPARPKKEDFIPPPPAPQEEKPQEPEKKQAPQNAKDAGAETEQKKAGE